MLLWIVFEGNCGFASLYLSVCGIWYFNALQKGRRLTLRRLWDQMIVHDVGTVVMLKKLVSGDVRHLPFNFEHGVPSAAQLRKRQTNIEQLKRCVPIVVRLQQHPALAWQRTGKPRIRSLIPLVICR